jgi:quinol---cytochrome c reductase iron-sulfur subunit, bacillus type
MAQPSHSPSEAKVATQAVTERRGFLARSCAVVIGAVVVLVPGATGLAVFLDPLRRRNGNGGKFIPVATLDAVPDDGVVRQFPVIAEHVDAWNQSREPIGAVYLRRNPGQEAPECLSATCPHAGCFVAFDDQTSTFKCPCHNSSFAPDGAIISPSPSPRAMDTLACKVRQDEILVQYENFYTGKTEKIVKQ